MSFCHATTTHKDNFINTHIKRLRLKSKAIISHVELMYFHVEYQKIHLMKTEINYVSSAFIVRLESPIFPKEGNSLIAKVLKIAYRS